MRINFRPLLHRPPELARVIGQLKLDRAQGSPRVPSKKSPPPKAHYSRYQTPKGTQFLLPSLTVNRGKMRLNRVKGTVAPNLTPRAVVRIRLQA